MITQHSLATMKVLSSNENSNKNEHFITNSESNISNDILKCSDEKGIHDKKDEENVEENLQDIACNSVLVDNSYLDSEIDHNKLEDSKENELKANDKDCNGGNNNSNTEKLLSKRFLDLIDSDSENESTLYETSEKAYNPNDEHLKVVKHKRNLKNKNVRKLIDSEDEDDTQMSKINDFSQTVDKTINITVSTNIYINLLFLSYFIIFIKK